MAKAYLKISVEVGMERSIRDKLLQLPAVKSADLTTGDQDIIAIIETSSYETILKTILDEMRQIEGVTNSSTSLVLD